MPCHAIRCLIGMSSFLSRLLCVFVRCGAVCALYTNTQTRTFFQLDRFYPPSARVWPGLCPPSVVQWDQTLSYTSLQLSLSLFLRVAYLFSEGGGSGTHETKHNTACLTRYVFWAAGQVNFCACTHVGCVCLRECVCRLSLCVSPVCLRTQRK